MLFPFHQITYGSIDLLPGNKAQFLSVCQMAFIDASQALCMMYVLYLVWIWGDFISGVVQGD